MNNSRFVIFTFLTLIPFFLCAQTQIGSDIDGENTSDFFGTSVAISSNGNTIAAGAYQNDGNGSNSGHVRVYRYINDKWAQLGSDIDGEAPNDESGSSIALSGNGNTIIIGAAANDGNGNRSGHVRVFELKNNNWVQKGTDIDGEAIGDKFGWSVDISENGNIISAGAIFNDGNSSSSGHVRAYSFKNNSWIQLGSDIDGDYEGDQLGNAVSLSKDGAYLAVGAYGNDENGSNAGEVKVFKYENSIWKQVGSDINGESADDYFGGSLSISDDGSVLAVGASRNDAGGTDRGHVRVYELKSNVWVQRGTDLDGNKDNDYFSGVSVSGNGNRIIVGASGNDDYANNAGQLSVYNYSSNSWKLFNSPINGKSANSSFGRSSAISRDGNVFVVGSSTYNDRGRISVYNICSKIETVDTISSCYQYKWTNGITYTENNNTAKDTFESFWGCDSIVTLNLTINKSSEVNIGVSVCDSFITPSGKTYYTSGNFVDTLINHLGCDSFLIYKLDVVKTDAIITQQPKDANYYVGETAKFSVKSENYPKATYQWQSDQGFGFQDLSNASQFSDVNTNTVSISDVRLTNDKQKFRCVIFEKDCSDTTNEVTLYVTDNVSVNNLINSDLISVYPIPFNDELNIKISSLLVGSTYTLFDIRGTIIKSGIFDKETNRINLSNICKGTYYLDVDKLKKPLKVIK